MAAIFFLKWIQCTALKWSHHTFAYFTYIQCHYHFFYVRFEWFFFFALVAYLILSMCFFFFIVSFWLLYFIQFCCGVQVNWTFNDMLNLQIFSIFPISVFFSRLTRANFILIDLCLFECLMRFFLLLILPPSSTFISLTVQNHLFNVHAYRYVSISRYNSTEYPNLNFNR